MVLAFLSCSDKKAVEVKQDAAVVDQGSMDRGAHDVTRPDSVSDQQLSPDQTRPPASWNTVQPMALARSLHTATLLQDGTVLVAGGRIYQDSPYYWGGTEKSERYDPVSDTWQDAGEMPGRHWAHQAVRLQDGRVLIIGGFAEGDGWTDMLDVGVALYDPNNPTAPWIAASPLHQDRAGHRAVLLQDGRVLVAGGWNNMGALDTMEIYDPKTDDWSTPGAVLSSPRQYPVLMALDDGRVLVAGGFADSVYLNSIDFFDPSKGTIAPSEAKLFTPLSKATGAMLPGGKILITGGYCNFELPPECMVGKGGLYDPQLDHLTPISLPYSHIVEHTTTRLVNGEVLLVGGVMEPQGAYRFDPALLAWTQTEDLHQGRMNQAATLLQDSRVLVTGGEGYDAVAEEDVYLDSVEIYTP